MKESVREDLNGLISAQSLEQDTQKRLLEAELLHRSHQLRNFDRFTSMLTAPGEDQGAAYKRLSAARELLRARLRTLDNVRADDAQAMSLVSRGELVVPRLGHAGEGLFVFGTEGCVALPRASDGISVVPNRSKTFGEIRTSGLGPLGLISFRGEGEDPADGFASLGISTTEESEQVWLHNWRYVVLFPCTPTEAFLSYTFTVGVVAQLFSEASGLIMAFTSIGEAPSASPTSDIVVTTGAGWPLLADVEEPSSFYNGSYGFKQGELTVERTFRVGAGRTPAIAIVVGFVVRLTAGRLRLSFNGDSTMGIDGGRVCYRYTPVPVLAQP
jgi:hypothetical protein